MLIGHKQPEIGLIWPQKEPVWQTRHKGCLGPKWVRLTPNGTNPGLFNFKIKISEYFTSVLNSDLIKVPDLSHLEPICSDALWAQI